MSEAARNESLFEDMGASPFLQTLTADPEDATLRRINLKGRNRINTDLNLNPSLKLSKENRKLSTHERADNSDKTPNFS